jgi:uncharacterized protein YqeY
MSILEKLNNELKSAMKAQQKARVNALRLLISDLKKEKIDKGGELTAEQELKVLLTAAKRRKEAIEAYQKGNRQDLVEIERQELEIINEYLPKQMSDEEIASEVKKIVEETGASSIKDLGKVMAEAMKRLKGKADGKKVQTIVRSVLA